MNRQGHGNTVPFLIACCGIATFAGMDALMKGLSIGLGAYNAMLWRTLIALVLILPLFLLRRGRWPERPVLKLHVWRGFIVSIMAYLFFWGLAHVPLAEAIALSFIAPLIALYLAAVLLGEQVNRQSVLASLIGLAGAIVIISGKLSGDYSETVAWGIAAILTSAVMYAYNLILQRQQALRADPVEIALFQSGTLVVVYLLFAPFLAQAPPQGEFPALIGAAVLSLLSILMLSWAYARAEARILLPVEYTAFIWASILGWLLFSEGLSVATLTGTALIVGGCLLAARQHPDDVAHVETTAV